MGGQKSKEYVSTPLKPTVAVPKPASAASELRRRIAQNFLLVWVDAGIDQSNKDSQHTLAQLRSVVNDVTICTQSDQCIQFLNDVSDEKAFVIVSGSLGQHLVPDIHTMPQLDAIYIFCGNQSRHEQWTKNWVKVKGVHTTITPICKALQLAAKQCNEDNISISFVSMSEGASGDNLNQLEPSFMYTQIFKEILLEMDFNAQAIKDLCVYCRPLYPGNVHELNVIKEFERIYRSQTSIWWYTRECFTYQMLNRALRNLEADTIINMGFLIRDLHHQIEQLHKKQVSEYRGETFVVYRGQSLSNTDFEKLRETKGGLMSFNNFLSTSTKRDVSLGFAKNALGKTAMFGILFQMSIDPSVSSTPFAAIREVSYFQTEEEILFSMHAVFRIGDIKQIDGNNPLYQVDLQLTSDDDPQLRALTERIRKETSGSTGWKRLGQLLLKIGQFNKAEELYKALLEQTSEEGEKAHYYNQLGYAKNFQGKYEKAIGYYKKSLKINQRTLASNDSVLATLYNNIAGVYENMKEYSKALSFYEKALEIRQKILHPNHPHVASSYNNIGGVYNNMKEYSKALSFYERALEIKEKTLPPNHPSLATSYNNIGLAYDNMVEYLKALSFYEKAIEIRQKTLPSNHPELAISYNNMATLYFSMKQYSKALSYFELALDIRQRSLPPNHPDTQDVQENIEIVKKKL